MQDDKYEAFERKDKKKYRGYKKGFERKFKKKRKIS